MSTLQKILISTVCKVVSTGYRHLIRENVKRECKMIAK